MVAPFILYLTVFRSRLGTQNIVVDLSGPVHQPDAALLRRLRQVLDETEDLSLADSGNGPVFQYLRDKGLIGRDPRSKGRYAAYAGLEPADGGWRALDQQGRAVNEVRTFTPDVWLSHADVPSTIGAPTPENAGEVLEMAFQLRVLARSKNTWTAAGHLVNGLRQTFGHLIADVRNPFLLGVEAVVLLRQVVAADVILFREVIREIASRGQESFTRDEIAKAFPDVVDRAVAVAKEANVSPPQLREALDFQRLIRQTTAGGGRSRRRPGARRTDATSRGPGVLEHRVSPRLEWLTDLGYLSKDGLPKNAFEYRRTQALHGLLSDLDEKPISDDYLAESVAVSEWWKNPYWNRLRENVAVRPIDEAFREGYGLMRRRIGPAPLREVALAAALMSGEEMSFTSVFDQVVAFAQGSEGATLSGGRYRRSPENIYVPAWNVPR
jgi:hypothetical protein